MFLVIVHVLGVYEDIVEVDDYKEVDHIMEYIVHEGLESGWRVCHTEGHDEVFIGAVPGPKSSLPFVSSGNADKIVCSTEVEFGKPFGLSEPVKQTIDERERVPVLFRNAIKSAVIHTKPKAPILLLDK